MATLFTAWYDEVVPNVSGAPLPIVLQKIRAAAIDFCKKSRVLRFRGLTPIDAVANHQAYLIGPGAAAGTLPANRVVAHVFQVNYCGERLCGLTPEQFRCQSDTWFSDVGPPESYTLFDEGEVSLYQIPCAGVAGAIVIPEIALAPSETAADIDDTIFQRWREVIGRGACSKLWLMPAKPWSNASLGEDAKLDFEAACGGAAARAAGGRGAGRIRSQTIIR